MDSKNDKSYYGESDNIGFRLSQHFRELSKGEHPCKALQAEYINQNDPKGFRLIVLEVGSQWKKKEDRLAKEDEYIKKNKTRCYNTVTAIEGPIIITPVMANGTEYPSLRAAARGEGMSRVQAKRNVSNPSNKDWFLLTAASQVWGKTPIFASKSPSGSDSVFFEGFADCIEAGYGFTKQYIKRKLQKEAPGWRYAHFGPDGKPSRFPYALKPREVAFIPLPADSQS